MSSSNKKTSISVPEYQKPTPSSFNTPWGSASFGGNGWNVTPSEDQSVRLAQNIRYSLLNSLGLGGDLSKDSYTNKYMDEILRIAQPKTENALIGRGLGGSTVYKDALTDLITKAGSQAILGGQQYKMNDLNALSGYLDNQYSMGLNLAQLASQTGLNEQQMAQQLYQALLPYNTTVNTPGNNGLMGALTGGLQGFMAGRPVGAAVGAGSGYASSRQDAYSTPYMLSDYYKNNNTSLSLQNLLKLQGAF